MRAQLFVLPFLHFGVGRLATDLMLAVRASGAPVVAVTCGWTGELGDDPTLVAECAAAGILFEHADVFSRDPKVMRETANLVDASSERIHPVLAHAFTAVSAAAVRRCPVLASVVGWSPSKAPWQRSMDVAILEKCAVVTAVSNAVASELSEAGLVRRPMVIQNGVPVPSRPQSRSSVRSIGVAAHLIERKGVDVLLEAISLLPRGTFETIKIAGTGEAQIELQALAIELSLQCSVEWCGQVSTDAFFEEIDVLVVPSRSDALPLILLNGMAAGLPIIASRTGGIPEALAADEGWLVGPGSAGAIAEALLEVRSDPGQAFVRGARAREHVRRAFSLERMTARYLECYERAAEVYAA